MRSKTLTDTSSLVGLLLALQLKSWFTGQEPTRRQARLILAAGWKAVSSRGLMMELSVAIV